MPAGDRQPIELLDDEPDRRTVPGAAVVDELPKR